MTHHEFMLLLTWIGGTILFFTLLMLIPLFAFIYLLAVGLSER